MHWGNIKNPLEYFAIILFMRPAMKDKKKELIKKKTKKIAKLKM